MKTKEHNGVQFLVLRPLKLARSVLNFINYNNFIILLTLIKYCLLLCMLVINL